MVSVKKKIKRLAKRQDDLEKAVRKINAPKIRKVARKLSRQK